jgi:adenosine deaminase
MRHTDRSLEIASSRSRSAVAERSASTSPVRRTASPRRTTARRSTTWHQFFPATVHAGEAAGLDSIRSALIDGRALRLGHGVRIAEDLEIVQQKGDEVLVTFGDLARWVRDREIPLELSPSSNLQTGAIARGGPPSRTTRSTCSTSSASP